MKMPRRNIFPDLLKPRADIFGLPVQTILGQAIETPEAKRKRIETVEKGVISAFKAASVHLGVDEARQLFKEVIRKPKRGKGKWLAANRDFVLLREFDWRKERESIAELAKRLHAAKELKLGSTPGAIAAQIRKLRDAREKSERKAKKQARYWRMATRHEKTLLATLNDK
jgi:hypothetical protein